MEREEPSDVSPVKRNPKGKYVKSGQKELIINLYKKLKQENGQITYSELINSLSVTTRIGKNTIKQMIAEHTKTGAFTSPNKKRRRLNVEKTSDADILAIRRKVHEFWIRREVPNLNNVLEAINVDEELPTFSRASLHRLLKRIEFRFMRRKRNSALIDKDYIVNWRQRYVKRIKELQDEGRPIFYLGETLFNAGDYSTSVSSSANAEEGQLSTGIPVLTGKGKRLIIGHLGSEDGFLAGGLLCFEAKKGDAKNYHDEMDGQMFFKWIEQILPKLPARAVIVMDNAPYHSVPIERYPTKKWQKADIVEWLQGKGESIVADDFVKIELLAIAERYNQPATNYVIDEYARERGYLILRIPPYHCELNPIELVWSQMKQYIRTRNTTFKLADIRRLVDEAIANVSPAQWKNYVSHTKKEEERFRQLDRTVDSVLEEHDDWASTSELSDLYE